MYAGCGAGAHTRIYTHSNLRVIIQVQARTHKCEYLSCSLHVFLWVLNRLGSNNHPSKRLYSNATWISKMYQVFRRK